MLARAGVQPKVVQDILRHSDIRLTMRHYTHTLVEDRAKAVGQLPNFSAGSLDTADIADISAKTGTYDSERLTHILTQTGDVLRPEGPPADRNKGAKRESEYVRETPNSSQHFTVPHRQSSTDRNAPDRTRTCDLRIQVCVYF